MNLYLCVLHLYPTAVSGINFKVEDHGDGPEVTFWDLNDSNGQPVPQPTLAELQAIWPEVELQNAINDKIEEIKNAREAEIQTGFTSSALGVEHKYGFNVTDEMRLNGQLNILNADTAGSIASVDWLTLDAGILTHTKQQFIQVCMDAFVFRETKTKRDYQLRAQVDACTTVAEVQAITW